MALRDELLWFVKENVVRSQGEISPDESLIDQGVLDSVGLVQLMGFLEERTGIRIPDRCVTPDNFRSVVSMERMVEGLRDEAAEG